MTALPDDAPLVDYAPVQDAWRHHRKKWARVTRRFLLLMILLGVAGWFAVRIEQFSRDRRAIAFDYPPHSLLFTEDAAEIAARTKSGFSGPDYSSFIKNNQPAQWFATPHAFRDALVNGEAFAGGAVAFMHGLTGPQGTRRVVAEFDGAGRMIPGYPPGLGSFVQVRVCRRVWPWQSGKMLTCGRAALPQIDAPNFGGPLRVYSGGVDPNDPASFAFECDAGAIQHTLRGTLRSDDKFDIWFDGTPLIVTWF